MPENMDKTQQERFLYMSNAARKIYELCAENGLEILGVIRDPEIKQSASIIGTADVDFMLFLQNVTLIRRMMESGCDFGTACNRILACTTAACNPDAHNHIWTMDQEGDEQ